MSAGRRPAQKVSTQLSDFCANILGIRCRTVLLREIILKNVAIFLEKVKNLIILCIIDFIEVKESKNRDVMWSYTRSTIYLNI